MDGSAFDTLVQSLGTAGSRRRALAGLILGSLGFLGWGRAEDAAAHDALPACKKKSGKQKKRCLKKARRHNATHLTEAPPATCATPCPVLACQICQNGTCVPANQGQICDTSGISGDHVRCCDGACPNPGCFANGYTGQPCTLLEDCAGITCCSGEQVACENLAGFECFCPPVAGPGNPCGSDADCRDNATATACICGRCQNPP